MTQVWNIKEHYFSGQGIVLLAKRGADGQPLGYRPVGNVPDLKIAVATTVLEHKESTTGQRGTDLRLTTETKVTVTFTLENFNSDNLAAVSRGTVATISAASVVDQAVKGYAGGISAVGKIGLTALTLKRGTTSLVPYTDDSTAWDYQFNLDAGSFKLNDGSVQAPGAGAEAITAATIGSTTSLAVANSAAIVGGMYYVSGFGGTAASLVNGKGFPVISVSSSAVVIAVDTSTKTLTGAGKGVPDGATLLASFSYGAQLQIDGLTQGASEYFVRFEGLNTADTDQPNSPVIVEVFRVLSDPFKELALIGDTVQSFALEGSALADTSRTTGSKYFRMLKLN